MGVVSAIIYAIAGLIAIAVQAIGYLFLGVGLAIMGAFRWLGQQHISWMLMFLIVISCMVFFKYFKISRR